MPENINTDITLDNVLNTGEDGNRIPNPAPNPNPDDDNTLTPEQIKAKADAQAAADSTGGDDDVQLTAEQIEAAKEENSGNLKTLLVSFQDESTLDEDNKSIRTQLLTEHKGTSFDAEGNILDAEGKVVATFDELLKYSTEEDKLTLDKEGNQINEKGDIVKSKLDLAIENTVVNKLHAESDYEFVDNEGNTKIYSDDDEGIKAFTDDVSGQRFEEWKSEFFGQHPELTEVAKHILAGNSIDTFNSAVDYSKIDAAALSKDDKLKYIRRSFEIAGLSEERINGLVQLFVDSNTIDAEVTKALPALQAHEEKIVQDRNDAYTKSIADRNKEVETYWGTVQEAVTKGTLTDISIPEGEKNAFFDYLSTAVDDKGNSKEMLDTKKETLEQQLQIKYLRFKGYDLSKLVNSKVKQTRVKSLREMIKQSAKIKTTPVNDASRSRTSGDANITIDSLLS